MASATLVGVGVTPSGAPAPEGPLVPVIVEGAAEAAAAEVERLGGVVGLRLSVLDGLHARVPAAGIPAPTRVDGVRAVTPDGELVALEDEWGDDDTGDVWSRNDPRNGDLELTGYGVGVALIDTGVTRLEGLDGYRKVVDGPDLSLDSQAAGTRSLDGYGHGTHMAGIIAGRDGSTSGTARAARTAAGSSTPPFTGMAPAPGS